VVDNCQHVLLGCCTNLINLYRRTGVEDKIRWYDELTFLEPGGRASQIAPSFLPAPLHNGPSFLGARCLGLRDKLSIARVMMALLRRVPEDNGQSFLAWLERRRPTPAALERFWKPILISALNEDLDRVSVFMPAGDSRVVYEVGGGRANGIPRIHSAICMRLEGVYPGAWWGSVLAGAGGGIGSGGFGCAAEDRAG